MCLLTFISILLTVFLGFQSKTIRNRASNHSSSRSKAILHLADLLFSFHKVVTRGGWSERESGEGVGGTGIKKRMPFFLYIRSMNGTSNRRTCQVGGEAQCAVLLFK